MKVISYSKDIVQIIEEPAPAAALDVAIKDTLNE